MPEIIQPASIVVPAVGGSYIDPAFGTTIKRITAVPDGRFGIPEYSSAQAFNCEGSRFLLEHVDHFALYDADGHFLTDLPVGASARPRWSRTDPRQFYFMEGKSLWRYDAWTGMATIFRRFGEFESIDNKGEADISDDGKLVLCGDSRFVFVYDPLTDKVGMRLDTEGHPFESLYITAGVDPLVLISWGAKGTDRFQGMELYDRDLKPIRNVTNANGHKCVGVEADGSPILIWNTSDEAIPPGVPNPCPNGMQKINLRTFERTCLLPLPWIEITHVAPGPGFCMVSTYSKPGGDWVPYRDEIIQVPYDGSPVKRRAHTRARTRTYEEQGWLTLNRAGTVGIFGSNMAAPETDTVDTYMILLGQTPIPTPPPTTLTLEQRVGHLEKMAHVHRKGN